MRTHSSDAQLVKAEAEYNLCHFEHALVTYYKGEEENWEIDWISIITKTLKFKIIMNVYFEGIKMNPEMEGFHHGVDKCKETISNIVRSTLSSFDNIIPF